jgi:hypothetical protein
MSLRSLFQPLAGSNQQIAERRQEALVNPRAVMLELLGKLLVFKLS